MASAKRCPECGDECAADYRPFCSKRCADVDLHRWLTGAYAIPAASAEDAGEEDAPSPALPATGRKH